MGFEVKDSDEWEGKVGTNSQIFGHILERIKYLRSTCFKTICAKVIPTQLI